MQKKIYFAILGNKKNCKNSASQHIFVGRLICKENLAFLFFIKKKRFAQM